MDTSTAPDTLSTPTSAAPTAAPVALQDLTPTTFDEAIRSADVPVVVDVWAPWCGPCHAVAPVLEAVAAEHRAELQVFMLNSDDHPEIAARFGVMGLPTLLVFDDGALVKRIVGAKGKARLLEELADVLRPPA